MESCERKINYKPTDWDEIEAYKQEAKALATEIEPRLMAGERISWDALKEASRINTTLWKLLLKELRLRGYSIGDSKNQHIFKK